MVAVSKAVNGAPKYMKLKVMPNLKSVTIGNFAKQNIAEFSKIKTNKY